MDTDNGEERVVRRGTTPYKRALTALFAIGVGAYALIYAPQPLLRVIGQSYEVSAAQSALLMSATTFALAFFVLFWGAMTSRIAERTIIIGGLAGAILISVIIPFAPNWPLLIALRALQGIALAGPLTATLAWVGRHVEAPSIAQVSGLYIAGTTVGGMTGRLLSGFVNELAGDWRFGIAAVSIMAVVLGGVAHLLLPRAKGQEAPRKAGATARFGMEASAKVYRLRVRACGNGHVRGNLQRPRLPSGGATVEPRYVRDLDALPQLPHRYAVLRPGGGFWSNASASAAS